MRSATLLSSIALAAVALACGNGAGSIGQTPSGASPAARLLVVTHTEGFRHDSIAAAESALQAIGAESGLFQTEFSRTAGETGQRLSPAALATVDAVFFANTTGDIGIPDMGAFLSWIRDGKAFLGAHSATDTYRGSPEFIDMIGGEFETHGTVVEAEVHVDDPSHPAVAHLVPSFRITDEWYRFRNLGRDQRVLLSFTRVPPDGLGTAGEPADLPLAWHKRYGSGRVFYTALGHPRAVWEDGRFRRHLLEAIQWALGR